tara:strand:- start:616 stop:819 length:204 start_codon:yes stop_codon:yes gene_type:complete
MHQYRIDEWVTYHQFPDADSEWLKKGKKAVILELLENSQYIIWIDDPERDIEWRRKKVNEADLTPID